MEKSLTLRMAINMKREIRFSSLQSSILTAHLYKSRWIDVEIVLKKLVFQLLVFNIQFEFSDSIIVKFEWFIVCYTAKFIFRISVNYI